MVDARGTRSREVRFLVDLVIQNLRPVNESIVELELEIGPDGLIARDRGPTHVAAAPPPPPAKAAPTSTARPPPAASKAPAVASAPAPAAPAPAATASAPAAASSAPATARVASAPPVAKPALAATPASPAVAARVPMEAPLSEPAAWKRKAGPWLTGLGVALMAGGAAVGYLNQDLANDLDARYANRQLTSADRASYDRVKTYNVVSTALFAAGGVAAATGAWIWISAPSSHGEPAVVGAGGRF
jgi:hypothetical protein